MKRLPKKSKVLDKLHHGFVWTCMGVTALGALNLLFRGYEYIVYVRPVRKAEEAKIEQELLKEGTSL